MKNKLILSLAVLLFAISYGCKKASLNQLDVTTTGMANSKSSDFLLTETDIGKKLDNPYTVANMRKALANLATKGDVKKVENLIATTHYYIKFMPKDEAQYDLLKVDSNLVIYPFPLDVKLSKNNKGNYREPGLPDGVPTYQYAAVPVGYKLPKVGYEVLADLYLPNERMSSSKVAANSLRSLGAPGVTVKGLVNEAERMVAATNGFEEELPPGDDGGYGGGGGGGGGSTCGAPIGEWRPSGRMTMTDDVRGSIGVEGLKIRAYRWFTTYIGFTDANGNYCVDGTFTRPANYWFDFERYEFSVNHNAGGPREISGPKIEGPWNKDFTGYDKFCATIFRAAFHYYYGDIQGLRRPPENSFFNGFQMKIGAYTDNDVNNTSPARLILNLQMIHIFTHPGESSDETYATTIHELAHAVHWNMYASSGWTITNTYTQTSLTVCESWATGVQYVLTRMVYLNYKGRWCNFGDDYKNVIMDMIDTPAEITYYQPNNYGFTNYGYASPQDEVEGYTIVQIQDALIDQTSWLDWRNNIKNLYNNGTENNLDALFNVWSNH